MGVGERIILVFRIFFFLIQAFQENRTLHNTHLNSLELTSCPRIAVSSQLKTVVNLGIGHLTSQKNLPQRKQCHLIRDSQLHP